MLPISQKKKLHFYVKEYKNMEIILIIKNSQCFITLFNKHKNQELESLKLSNLVGKL